MRIDPARPWLLLAVAMFSLTPGSAPGDTSEIRHSPPMGMETAETGSPDEVINPTAESDAVRRMIELTNRERTRAGLPPLKRRSALLVAASWMAKDMSDHAYFDHRDSEHRELAARLSAFHYGNYRAIGENIAMGQRTPEDVVECWMNSPGHRANILSPEYSEIGVAYIPPSVQNAYGYWVQDFGSRFNAYPLVINNDALRTGTPCVRLSFYGKGWAEQMRLSNDGVTWSDWETFASSRDWTLVSGAGARRVYVELRRDAHIQRAAAAIVLEPSPGSVHTVASASLP